MPRLEFDLSGKDGLAPRGNENLRNSADGAESTILGGASQMADGVYNSLRRYGYLSPSTGSPTDLTYSSGTPAARMTSSVVDTTNSYLYMAERGQVLWQLDSVVDTVFSPSVDLGSTGTPKIMDLEIYQVNDVRKLFVIYETGDNLEIAISNLPYDTGTDNLTWLSTTVSGTAGAEALASEAFMETADNGFAYLFRNNRVDKIDGTNASGGANGTITNNVLLFPTNFTMVDAKDYRGNMYIGIHSDARSFRDTANNYSIVAKCGVYIWDRFSTIIQTRDYIPIEGAKYIRKLYISTNGRLRAITQSSIDNIGEIREFDGSTFQVIREIGKYGYPQSRDGLTITPFGEMWIAEDRNIYLFGKPHPTAQNTGLYKIYDHGGDAGSVYGGALELFGAASPGLYFGNMVSSTANAYRLYFMGEVGSLSMNQGDVYTMVKYLPDPSTLHDLNIYMFPSSGTGSGTCATIKIYMNQSSTPWASKIITFDEAASGFKKIVINESNVHAVQLEIEFSTTAADDLTNFFPSRATIDYDTPRTHRR